MLKSKKGEEGRFQKLDFPGWEGLSCDKIAGCELRAAFPGADSTQEGVSPSPKQLNLRVLGCQVAQPRGTEKPRNCAADKLLNSRRALERGGRRQRKRKRVGQGRAGGGAWKGQGEGQRERERETLAIFWGLSTDNGSRLETLFTEDPGTQAPLLRSSQQG